MVIAFAQLLRARSPDRTQPVHAARATTVLGGALAFVLVFAIGGKAIAQGAGEPGLGPDDRRAFPDAPAGFRDVRPGVAPGRVEAFAYRSGITGTDRKANVYRPAGYSSERKYPVLYLLHGIAGNHDEWRGYVRAHTILDNLIGDGKAVPMILVMPNGRAPPDDSPPPSDRIF